MTQHSSDTKNTPLRTAWPSWGDAEMASELAALWSCGIENWSDYIQRLTNSQTPLAMYEAGTQLLTDGLELCSRAAAARLRHGGVKAPLLNDA